MAGGEGTRLWPLSTKSKPKQFFDITGIGKSLIRQTFERFNAFIPTENIIIVTSSNYIDLVKGELPELPCENILGEPYVRDTSPAITYATYSLLKRNPEATMVVSPADMLVENEDTFKNDILSCLEYASKEEKIITLGVKATRPEKNFGYIQVNETPESDSQENATSEKRKFVSIKTFIEKPAEDLAEVLISSGEFYWSSGLYTWKASTIKGELEKHLPELTQLFKNWEEIIGTDKEHQFITTIYSDCIKNAFPYGILEKTDKASFYLAHFGWIDVGSWPSISKICTPEAVARAMASAKTKVSKQAGKNDIAAASNKNNSKLRILNNASDNLIISKDDKKLIIINDLSDYMVIDTEKVLVICPRNNKEYQSFLDDSKLPGLEEYR